MATSTPPGTPRAADRVEHATDLRKLAEARLVEAALDAKRLALEALYALEADPSAPAAAVTETLLTLGSAREALGELDAAETTYRRALALLNKAPRNGQLDGMRTRSLARLGQVYCLQGRYDDADALSTHRPPKPACEGLGPTWD